MRKEGDAVTQSADRERPRDHVVRTKGGPDGGTTMVYPSLCPGEWEPDADLAREAN